MNVRSGYGLNLNVSIWVSILIFDEYLLVFMHLLAKVLCFVFMFFLELLKLIELSPVIAI